MFLPLGRKEINEIVRLQFKLIANRLEKQGIVLEITDTAVEWIASVGFDLRCPTSEKSFQTICTQRFVKKNTGRYSQQRETHCY
jgi:hypothetical protein